jgi:ubiquinol-cytochrome c reductase cytochrome b subunit
LQTPVEIVPQWYFLPFYAILRSVSNKAAGVRLMFGAIGVIFFLPWLDTSPVRSARFRPIYRPLTLLLVAVLFILGEVGAHRPEGLWVITGQICTAYYFFHFLIALPLMGKLERPLPLPESISRPVLQRTVGGGHVLGGAIGTPVEKAWPCWRGIRAPQTRRRE